MRTPQAVLLALASFTTWTAADAQSPCATVGACVQFIKQHAKGHGALYAHSMHAEDEKLVEGILEIDGIVPAVIPLLRDPDDGIANFAGIILRDAGSIEAKFLPDIRAGLDRDLGWLSPALCAMPGDAPAREAVQRFLVSKDAPTNQEAFAVEKCGLRAVPFILAAANCSKTCLPGTHDNLAYVIREMKPPVAEATGPGLLNIVRDPKISIETARGVLTMIAALGSPGASLQRGLVEVRTRRPALAASVDAALVGIHADTAGRILARRLDQMEPGFDARRLLHDIAALGAGGRDAGEEVLRKFGSDDWDTRVAAARAFGFIGYQPAVKALIGAVEDPADVRLNLAAAESLGWLRDPAAVDVLRRTSIQHWYPPVRRVAAESLARIQGNSASPARPSKESLSAFFSDDIGRDERICATLALPEAPDSVARQSRASSTDNLKASYPTEDEGLLRGRKPGTVMEVPELALRVPGGWLTGTDHGEWGGKLMFVGDGHVHQKVLDENVHDIWRLGDRIVALTGLAHLGFNYGRIQEVRKSGSGDWLARPWRILPGSPGRSRMLETGEIAIDVASGGTLLLSKDGSMRMAPCREFKKGD